MATKLSIYNDALTNILGARKISALTDNVPERHWLDSSWDAELVRSILEDVDWNFAMKTVRSTYDSSVEPEFGHQWAHPKPSDLWRLNGVWLDDDLQNPARDYQYLFEGEYLYSDYQTLYIKYTPSTVLDDIANWPAYFARHVAGQLAKNAAPRFKKTRDVDIVATLAMERERKAKGDDAQRRTTKSPVPGNWVSSRVGGRRLDGHGR